MDGDAAAACWDAPFAVDDGVVDRAVDGRRAPPPDWFAVGRFFCAVFVSGLETIICGRLVDGPCGDGSAAAGAGLELAGAAAGAGGFAAGVSG
jgi:hypothetical protein